MYERLKFMISDQLKPDQYEIIAVKRNVLIKIKDKSTYLINGDINGVADSIECKCGYLITNNDIGSIISGNGDVKGILLCPNCRIMNICEFEEKSREAVVRAFNLSDEMINHEWGDFHGQYIH